MAQVLVQEDTLAAKSAFDKFLLELQDSNALNHLIEASDKAVAKNEAKTMTLASVTELESEKTDFGSDFAYLSVILFGMAGVGLYYASSRVDKVQKRTLPY